MADSKYLDDLLDGVELIEEPQQGQAPTDILDGVDFQEDPSIAVQPTIEPPKNSPSQGSILMGTKQPEEIKQPTDEEFAEGVGKVLSPIGKAADYAGGVARTAIAAPFSENVELSDVGNALAANPLSGSEILERTGVDELGTLSSAFPSMFNETGEGVKLQKGGPLDISGRGALGFALEVATDPLTYTPAILAKASEILKAVGTTAHATPLAKVDRALELAGKGKGAYSKQLLEQGVAGSAEEIEQQVAKNVKSLGNTQRGILEEASAKGATVDAGSALTDATSKISDIKSGKNIPQVKSLATQVEGTLDSIIEQGTPKAAKTTTKQVPSSLLDQYGKPVVSTIEETTPEVAALTASEASKIKSQLYNALGDESFNLLSKDNEGSKLLKSIAKNLKQATETAVGEADPELLSKLIDTNKQLEVYLTGTKPLSREVTKEIGKDVIGAYDPVLAVFSPEAALAKKVVQYGKGTGPLTKGGLRTFQAGKSLGAIKAPIEAVVAGRAGLHEADKQVSEPNLERLDSSQMRNIAEQDKLQKIVNQPETLQAIKFKTQNPKLRNLIEKMQSGNPLLKNSAMFLIKSSPDMKQEIELHAPSDEDLDYNEQIRVIRERNAKK